MSSAPRRLAARAALLSACLFLSLYALLCYIPFTWTNFIGAGHYPSWVGHGLHWYPLWLALASLAGAYALDGRRRLAFGAAVLAAAAAASAAGLPRSLPHGPVALSLAFAALLPLAVWERLVAPPPTNPPLDPDAALGGRFGGALTAALYCATAGAAGYAVQVGRPDAVALGWSVLTHAALFAAVALALDALSRLPRAQAWRRAATLAALSFVLARWAFASFSFTGPAAWLYAAAVSALLLRALDATRRELATPGPAARALLLAALACAPLVARRTLRGADWNGLLADLAALAVWAAAAALLAPPSRAIAPGRVRRWALGLAAVLWAFDAVGTARVESAVRALASDEPSLRAARRLLLARPSGESGFYAYLAENTNLPRGTVRPKSLAPAPGKAPLSGERPNIFIIVIDSMRPDYIGAYEPRVRFTPSLDAFAREADRFPHAFTQYGATGLSTPSLWAGARLPHEQYPSPFSPFNTLEALIEREGYRPLITLDTILSAILSPGKAPTALDRHTTGNYRLCATLEELEGRLGEAAPGRPLFVYTQPQDVHISVLQRDAVKPGPDPRFVGFHAPYASRVAQMDACFGRFIAALKTRGLYDHSIVIVTADHGDSLGEGGRWGHAYTLYPEVVKVPLLVRLPPALRLRLTPDLEAPAFVTDIAPTLHAALGRPTPAVEEPFGRPLYAEDAADLARTRRPERLLVSSYGPVYGVLRGSQSLFVADGVRFETLFFDLRRPGDSSTPSREQEEAGRAAIRRHVDSLRAFYGY